jgi:hypothetical protein
MSVRRACHIGIGLLAIAGTAAAVERPNLLLILTDNQSPSLLGAYGNTEIRTPNIDRLAAEGMLFTRAFATSGVCSPARATPVGTRLIHPGHCFSRGRRRSRTSRPLRAPSRTASRCAGVTSAARPSSR